MRDIVAEALILVAAGEPVPVAGVRVVFLRAEAAGVFIEEECVVHKAAPATIVPGVTIDKLLLREGYEVSRVNEASTLDSTNRTEGPTAATHSLILHGRDSTLRHPIGLLGKVRGVSSGCDSHAIFARGKDAGGVPTELEVLVKLVESEI